MNPCLVAKYTYRCLLSVFEKEMVEIHLGAGQSQKSSKNQAKNFLKKFFLFAKFFWLELSKPYLARIWALILHINTINFSPIDSKTFFNILKNSLF